MSLNQDNPPFKPVSDVAEDPLSNFEPVEYSNELQRALSEDCVDAIDSQPFLQVTPLTTVKEAVELLERRDVSSLLVVENDRLVGIFTERDVLERVVERYERILFDSVADYMTHDPTIVYKSDPAGCAAAAIAVAGHRHVPVLDLDDRVCGIVSPRRVFAFMEKHL